MRDRSESEFVDHYGSDSFEKRTATPMFDGVAETRPYAGRSIMLLFAVPIAISAFYILVGPAKKLWHEHRIRNRLAHVQGNIVKGDAAALNSEIEARHSSARRSSSAPSKVRLRRKSANYINHAAAATVSTTSSGVTGGLCAEQTVIGAAHGSAAGEAPAAAPVLAKQVASTSNVPIGSRCPTVDAPPMPEDARVLVL